MDQNITVSFDNVHAGNLFDGSFKGVRDGEEFCSIWYRNRTLGRNENEGNVIIDKLKGRTLLLHPESSDEGDSTPKEPFEDGNSSDSEENGTIS